MCACAIRDAVQDLGVTVRLGLHTGEVEMVGDDAHGIAVHIAARIMALARPGEVLVSGAIPPLVLGSNITFSDRGSHKLKGVPGQWAVLAVQSGLPERAIAPVTRITVPGSPTPPSGLRVPARYARDDVGSFVVSGIQRLQ